MAKRNLAAEFAAWRNRHTAPHTGSHTSSGLEIKELYLPEAEANPTEQYLTNLGFPGEFPYTRGVQASMYRGRPWTMRQYAGFGTASTTNERFKFLLKQGTNGLSVAFDLPTQLGRDSDHALAAGEVGRVGVAIDSIEDMLCLFEDIPLADVSTSMTINATAHILLALYLAVAEQQNVPAAKLRGTVQNDILKEYIARGTYIYPPKVGIKLSTDIIEFCRDVCPQWNTISISGYHIREAGSTAVQELALTLANGLTYVEAALARGLAIDDFAPRLAFFFNCHNNFLEEIAKFRAARRLWARLIRNNFQPQDPKSCMLRFHTQTAGSSLTAQQPLVNTVRTTLQALAAVLGGTQSLHTNSFDEALGLPTSESATLALRTQQVIKEESGVADFIDPLGGSFAIEELTTELEQKASELLEQIKSQGGMLEAIEARFPQSLIEEASYQYQKGIERDEIKIVGLNCYKQEDGDFRKPNIYQADPRLELEQKAKLLAFKTQRNVSEVQSSLAKLKQAAQNNLNVLPSVLHAVKSGLTLGEISDCFREVWGEYR